MKQLKNIGLFGNFSNASVASVTDQVTRIFDANGITYVQCASPFDTNNQSPAIDNRQFDLAIVIGGDGTFMNVARLRAGCDAPLLGINLGRRGFLTDVAVREIDESMDLLLNGHYVTETRILIEATISSTDTQAESIGLTALNDIVVHKTNFGRLLDFNITVDRQFVTSLRGDGVIIATPTGATAYALSAGGPVLYPSLPAIEMVPIAPHTLTQRPVIFNDTSTIEIELVNADSGNASLVVDGHIRRELSGDEKIAVRRSKLTVDFVRIEGHTYFNALRQKLSWGV